MAPKRKRFDRRNPKKSEEAKPKATGKKQKETHVRKKGKNRRLLDLRGTKEKNLPKQTNNIYIYIPRDQLSLYFACALYFAGPIYCAAPWVCLVTSRRISETLLLRHSDVNLEGGGFHDSPHILYQQREKDLHLSGQGKLGEEQIAARLSTDAVEGLKSMKECGLDWQCLPVLEPYKISHPEVFEQKPLQKRSFHLKTDDDYMFPAMTKKSGCRPNMARQSINMALDKIRSVMYELTGQARRWNPEQKCKGQRVTVHGATRHTSAALLLFNRDKSLPNPSEHVILEIQQRSDARVLRKHYFHADESEVTEALEYGAAPSPFGKRKPETIEDPKIVSLDSKTDHESITSESNAQKNEVRPSNSKTDHERLTFESGIQKEEPHPSDSKPDHESITSESNAKKNPAPPGPCSSKVQPEKQHKFVSRNVAQLQCKLCKQ